MQYIKYFLKRKRNNFQNIECCSERIALYIIKKKKIILVHLDTFFSHYFIIMYRDYVLVHSDI